MSILDFFRPNVDTASADAALSSFDEHASMSGEVMASRAASGSGSSGSGGSQSLGSRLSEAAQSLKNAFSEFKSAFSSSGPVGKNASQTLGLSSGSNGRSTLLGTNLGAGSAVDNPSTPGNQSLVSLGTSLYNLGQDISASMKPTVESKIKSPTKIVTVEMPSLGDPDLNAQYLADVTNISRDYWAQKYADPSVDREAAMKELKEQIDKAPAHTTQELLDRARLVAEYQFLEAVKNYGICMDYDLQGGYDEVAKIDKQLEEMEAQMRRYDAYHAGSDAESWLVNDEMDEGRREAMQMTEEEYEQMRADHAALEQYRAALKLEVDSAKHIKIGSVYNDLANRSDFQDYVQRGAKSPNNKRLENADDSDSFYSYMTDEEAAMYDFLLGAAGEKEAERYYEEYLGQVLRMRMGQERADNWNSKFGDTGWGDLGRTVSGAVIGAGTSFVDAVKDAALTVKAGATGQRKEERELSSYDYQTAAMRENAAKMNRGLNAIELAEGHNLSELVFDASTSGGRMLPMILTGKFLRWVPGVSAGAAKAVAAGVMSAGIYGSVKDEMTRQGYNDKSAAAYAALSAASETAVGAAIGGFEAIGGMMEIPGVQSAVGNIGNAYLRFALTMGLKMHAEGQEEYIQDMIDPLFKYMATGEAADFSFYTEEGVYSYLVAAASVFGTESFTTLTDVKQCEAAGAYVNAVKAVNPELYNQLLDAAIDSGNDEIADFAENIKSGEYAATNGNLGQLLTMIAQAETKSTKWKTVKEAAENFVKKSAADLSVLKYVQVSDQARSKAQQEFDNTVALNPGAKIFTPVAQELAERAGFDADLAEEQAEILNKIFTGIVPTASEVKKLDLNNSVVQDIIERYTGVKLDMNEENGTDILLQLVRIANNATRTQEYQEALKQANESFLQQRTNELMDTDFAPQAEKAVESAFEGTNQKIGKPSLSKEKSKPIIPPARGASVSGSSGMDRDSFIKDYMQRHEGATEADAAKAWEKNAAYANMLFGGDNNGEQIFGTAEERIDGVAERGGASEVHERGAGSGQPGNDTGAEEGSRSNSAAAQTGARVEGKVIDASNYTDEQKAFVADCEKDGFTSVTIVDGDLRNEAGQLLNAKVDRNGNLTIRNLDAHEMSKIRKHERVHLWLNALGDGRADFVITTLNNILSEKVLARMVDKYLPVYKAAHPNISSEALGDVVLEEILCDMCGGMDMHNAKAGMYSDAAIRLVEKAGLQEQFLQGNQTATEEARPEAANIADATAKAEDSIEDRVRHDINWDDDGADLPSETKDKHWQDDEYYSVAEDTPRQAPAFLSPFKADTNQTVPPDTRAFPGEQDMHDGLEKFSIASMAEGSGFELKLNSAGYPYQVIDKATGKPVTEVTAKMMVDTPLGNLVQMAMTDGSLKDLSDTEKVKAAKAQYQMLANAMNLIVKYNDAAPVWELMGSQMFSAIKSNSDTQYNRTIDFSTICKKTQAIVDAMSATMIQLNRGLTRREVEAVYLETGKAGESTPCPVCYVFSRWMGIGNLLDQINTFQNRYANMDEAEIVSFMEDIERRAHEFAEGQINKIKDPEKQEKKRKSFYDDNGELKIGKVLSSMKPNSAETAAIKALSAHQQAMTRIAEIEAAMENASPTQKAEYQKWIKDLRKLTLFAYNKDGSVKSDAKLAATQEKLQTADASIEELEAYQWLASTLMMKGQKQENGRPVFNENGEAVNTWMKNPKFKPVPAEVLFDLNRGADFAHDYPLTWAFRTGKGCAMGKAITPYADARVGETIQGVAGNIKDIRVGGDINEFLNGDTKKQKATLASAIKAMKRQNLIGGMRYQSTSDFRYEYGSDYLMTFFEMQAMGANVQLYTKVIEAVDFLASTGADCNLSLMPLHNGYEVDQTTGEKRLIFSDVTGINHEAAIAKAKQYDNVQCILVGINDTNILLALESTDVTFVIPFHGSGQSVHQIQTLMNLLGENLNVMEAQDYTYVQSDHVDPNRTAEQEAMWNLRMDIIMGNLEGGVDETQQALLAQNPHLQKLYNMFYVDQSAPAFHNYLAKAQAQQIFPYEYWDKTTTYETADRNGEIFKSYCESMGIIPRFSGKDSGGKDQGFGNFAYGGENGQCVKGYWKLLIDRKMYKNSGEYREQQQINMSNVKLENLDEKWGKAHFTEKEMSKPIDPSKTKDIVAESIKAIEILRATGDIYDRTAVTPKARETLARTDLNHQPTSTDLMRQQMAEMGKKDRFSVANEADAEYNEPKRGENNGEERPDARGDQQLPDRVSESPRQESWTEAAFEAGRRGTPSIRPEAAWRATEPKARRVTDAVTEYIYNGGKYLGAPVDKAPRFKTGRAQEFTDWVFDLRYHHPGTWTALLDSAVTDAGGLIAAIDTALAVEDSTSFPAGYTPTDADKAYLAAVKANDVPTLYKDVKTAADKAGYTLEAYQHSNGKNRFEAFGEGEFGFHIGSWSQAVARIKTNRESIILPLFANVGNAYPLGRDLQTWGVDEVAQALLRDYRAGKNEAQRFKPYYADLMNLATNRKYKGIYDYNDPARSKLTDIIEKAGFNSIEYQNEVEGDDRDSHTAYLLWDPERLKSADLITYDQDGNVIPISQRFDTGNDKYRYSIATTESTDVRADTGDGRFALDEDVEQEPVISPETNAKEIEETDTRFSIRDEDPPKKTMIGYKVFRADKRYPGMLFPTKVANPEGQGTPVGVWLNADTGEIARNKDGSIKTNKSGRIAVKAEGGSLAWRPGWHLGSLPEANQMNRVDPNNPESTMANRDSTGLMWDDYVFCECEFAADEDYQLDAFQMGFSEKGSYKHTEAGLPYIPKDGYYKYRTNPNPNTAPWFISGAIKITKILDDTMRREIIDQWNAEHPDEPMRLTPRYSGKDIDLSEYGLTAGPVTPTKNLGEIAPGVDYSDEIKDLPGYKPNHINWENENFQNAFKINGIENRKEELRQKYEANQERYSIFSDQVDEVKANTFNKKEAVNMGQTARPLSEILWLPKLPMFITPNHVYSMAVSETQARAEGRFKPRTNYHDLGWDTVKKIPEQLGHPVLIIKSNTDPTNADVLILTDLVDKQGRPVAVAVRPDGRGRQVGVDLPENAALSGYGRKNVQSYIARAKTENRILYANKNNHLNNSRGVQYSNAIMTGDYNNNLAQYRQIVKDKFKGTLFENSVGLNYSIADTETGYPKGGLEDTMLTLVKKGDVQAAEDWINETRAKVEAGRQGRDAKPVIPRADKAVPVGKEQRRIMTNQLADLINKYGQLPTGEKASRQIALPTKTEADQRVRRFVRTAEEAKATPQRMVDQIDRELLGDNALTYARITDAKAIKKADSEYGRLGYGRLKQEWAGRAETAMPSKYDIALGERLYIEAARQGDDAFALRVLADVAAMGTAAGQVVQAMRLLKKMGPVGQLYYFQKAVDRLNKQNESRIAKGSMAPIQINQDLARQVMLAETQKEIDTAMKDLIKDTANQLPVTLKDKWDAWRYLAMLGNPRTHIRNILGNTVFVPVRFTRDLLAAAGQGVFLKDRSDRTKSASYLLNRGQYKEIRDFAKSDFEVMKAEITGTGKLNPVNELMQARDIFDVDFLNKLSEFNSDWLEKEDAWFLESAYVNAMSQYLAAKGMTAEDLTSSSKELNMARQYAAQEAQKATYRDYCRFATMLNNMKRIPVVGMFIDGLVPFAKTPANILKRGFEYSPIGLIKSMTFDLNKVRQGDITAAEAIENIASGMTGTMIAALGWFLAARGIARGGPDDDEKKDRLEKTQGHQDYSLEIGGRSYTIDWMAPVALPFFVGVEIYDQMRNGDKLDAYDFIDAMTQIADPMMSLSMLDGINSALSSAAYGRTSPIGTILTNVATSYVSQGLPTLGGQIARSIDPYRRSTYVDKNNNAPAFLQRFVQQAQGKIPGLADDKMAYVDMWGRKDDPDGDVLRVLENFVFPFYTTRIRENPVEHELLRLAEATGDNSVLPTEVAKSFSVDGKSVDLTAKQYERLKTVSGKEALKLLSELTTSPAYYAMDDAERVTAIKNALSITTAVGRQSVKEGYKPAAWVQRAIDNDNYEAAAMFHTLQSLDTGLTNYQIIECMYWLSPEDQGKLITAQYTPQVKMTDYTQKHYKFILDDDMKARSREIYEDMFWPEYQAMISSVKWMNAGIADRANMVKQLQTDVGKEARKAYGNELRAAGVQSVYVDDPEEEAAEIAALINELGYEE